MTPEEKTEFDEQDKADGVSRREFLQVLAASFAVLGASGCGPGRPTEKIIPLAQAPEDYVPGLAKYYATTCGGCPAGCGVVAKSRDGRPIKLEGNAEHPLNRGGLCARGQATVLDLYDTERVRGPLQGGKASSWKAADAAVRESLADARRGGKKVRVVSGTLLSPAARAALDLFLKAHPHASHVAYDAVSHAAILEAHARTHGRPVLPHYRFAAAQAVVSFDADFLGTWLSPVEFARDWAANRRPIESGGRMSWLAQFEPRLSVTGAKADLHVPLKPSEELATVVALGRRVAHGLSWRGRLPAEHGRTGVPADVLQKTAEQLVAAGKAALVVSGSADPAVQAAVNWINEMTGAYGSTLDVERPSKQGEGDPAAVDGLIGELKRGEVGTLILWDANPAYDHPRGAEFAKAMAGAKLSVAMSQRKDETAVRADWVLPTTHALESWGDAEPVPGVRSLFQPLVNPLFDSRSPVEGLLAWAGKEQGAYDFLREAWRRDVYPRRKEKSQSFDAFWDEAVGKGVFTYDAKSEGRERFRDSALEGLAPARKPASGGGLEVVAYPNVTVWDGRQANNPWLQEVPDPISRASWGNYASFSPADAARLGVVEGRIVRLAAGDLSVELPAQVQPGLPEGVVAAALGYGRRNAGKVAANYPTVKMLPIPKELLSGADMYPFLRKDSVAVTLTDRMDPLAKVQRYDYQTDPYLGYTRPQVREISLQDFRKDPSMGHPPVEQEKGLWPGHKYPGRKWAMAIDLNACTGCGGCVVACYAENNIPVVGKSEVRRSRDMAWLRIDRYYAGSPSSDQTNPETSFQPMMCQHCDNAPCETVCPVLATLHSSEGLNMQVYNRCVGTRYCENNCPYKVRRFNWFDYAHQDLVENLALNPDVTVRSRGVMEKCSFCSQRIYAAEGDSAVQHEPMKDGAVKTACQQSCPAQAIVFGDINDPDSAVSKAAKDPRSYRVLQELGVGPSVFYHTKVTNKQV
ncbi:MAG: 4Fe-4S dicluster domain-containing protein [Elusimicrobia bacterium]|nr:4Fe-4S dicluster domain-containing protein [Elusimicrobiota bacterium]